MPVKPRVVWACAALVSLCAARSGIAQGRLEVGGLIGFYAPTGSFGSADYHSSNLPSSPQDLTALSFGGQFRLWSPSRIGLQLEGSTASMHVGGGGTPEGNALGSHANVLAGTIQLLYSLSGPDDDHRFWLSAGFGFVRHGGDAYRQYGSPVAATGVLGLGSTFPLAGRLHVMAGVTGMVYNLRVRDGAGASLANGRQVDIRLQTGLAFALH